jgi:hypothetical protein
MNTYSQSTGRCLVNGELFTTCYSGIGEGLNNPDMQEVHNIGPTPRGLYIIGPPYHHPKLGELTMNIVPRPNTLTFGRTDFRVHADLYGWPSKHRASHGCIIMLKAYREKLAVSLDRELDIIY